MVDLATLTARRRRALVTQSLAGKTARSVFGWIQGTSLRVGRGDDDRAFARTYFEPVQEGETLGHVWDGTRRLVREDRAAIGRVAVALLDLETIEGDERRDLIDSVDPGERRAG